VGNWADTYGALLDRKVLGPFLDREVQLEDLRQAVGLSETLLLVAVDGADAIGGFALTYMAREPEPWLESLHVLIEFRGHGMGTQLMQSTAAHLHARGYDGMRLGVIAGNDAAARFYERLGGSLIGLEPVSWAEGAMHQVYRWSSLTKLADNRP
jgi:ribosomal protein S18 acetylase RimI-like enzyme